MNVLLIDPPGPHKGLNVGLGYLTSSLTVAGYEVYALDLNNRIMGPMWELNESLPASEVYSTLGNVIPGQFRPDVVGVSVKSFTALVGQQIIAFVREMAPWARVLVGGPHVSLAGEEYLKETGADVGFLSESEVLLPRVCEALTNGGRLDDIEGLVLNDDGHVHTTGPIQFVRDLDRFPFPDYTRFSSIINNGRMIDPYPLITSRGCPYHCTYCSVPQIVGRKLRTRSPQNVVEELRLAQERHDSTHFHILDDNFTLHMGWAKEVCQALIEADLGMTWDTPNGVRADRLDRELLELMYAAGCRSISIGIEAVDDRVLEAVKKVEKLDQIRRAIGLAHDAGIHVLGFFIIGLPYSNIETDLKTVDFVKETGIEGFWGIMTPYPHTEVWDWVQENARVLTDYRLSTHSSFVPTIVFETDDYSREERIEAYFKIHLRAKHFYRLAGQEPNRAKRALRLVYLAVRYDPRSLPGVVRYLWDIGLAKLGRFR